jgi:hypothetical protein
MHEHYSINATKYSKISVPLFREVLLKLVHVKKRKQTKISCYKIVSLISNHVLLFKRNVLKHRRIEITKTYAILSSFLPNYKFEICCCSIRTADRERLL